MTAAQIQTLIQDKIPMLRSMGLQILELGERHCVGLTPLDKNLNHKGTAFGGSLYNSCVGACYALMYKLQSENQLEDWDLVIASATMTYKKPTVNDYFVEATVSEFNAAEIRKALLEKKKMRLHMVAQVRNSRAGAATCRFEGKFTFV